jgi:hypothetical protein
VCVLFCSGGEEVCVWACGDVGCWGGDISIYLSIYIHTHTFIDTHTHIYISINDGHTHTHIYIYILHNRHTHRPPLSHLHMHLQPPRAEDGVVDHVLAVGEADDQGVVERVDAVELREELVHYLRVVVVGVIGVGGLVVGLRVCVVCALGGRETACVHLRVCMRVSRAHTHARTHTHIYILCIYIQTDTQAKQSRAKHTPHTPGAPIIPGHTHLLLYTLSTYIYIHDRHTSKAKQHPPTHRVPVSLGGGSAALGENGISLEGVCV